MRRAALLLVAIVLLLVALPPIAWRLREPSAAQVAELEERWARTVERAFPGSAGPPARPPAERAAAVLEARDELDGEPSRERLLELVDEGLALVREGLVVDALAGLTLAVESLERARELGLDLSSELPDRRATPEDLARALVADAVVTTLHFEETEKLATDDERAVAFLTAAAREAAADTGDAVWSVRHDLAALAALEAPHSEEPPAFRLWLASVLRDREPWVRWLRSSTHPPNVTRQWRELTERWDAASAPR